MADQPSNQRATDEITINVVAYREVDHGPADYRVDIDDVHTRVTLASLTPDEADAIARDLRSRSLQARARAERRPRPVAGRPMPDGSELGPGQLSTVSPVVFSPRSGAGR